MFAQGGAGRLCFGSTGGALCFYHSGAALCQQRYVPCRAWGAVGLFGVVLVSVHDNWGCGAFESGADSQGDEEPLLNALPYTAS